MKLYNTKSRKLEAFTPLVGKTVRIYSCGPTVYDYVHIGNMRAFCFADTLKKTLQFLGYDVIHVMNITDFGHLVGDGDDGEDKMSVGLKRENLPRTLSGMRQLADKYIKTFLSDMQKMNNAESDYRPLASEHIPEYIEIIKKLDQKGFVYKTKDGLYFDTAKDKNYGKMALLDKTKTTQSRIGENTDKKSPQDFALWKFAEEDRVGFQSEYGYGFPGWHIECSGMSMKYLGETFDIHTGGVDHINVHHTNEIAQSENATGKMFANFFCHNAFVEVNSNKMSKSLGTGITSLDIEENGSDMLDYRYFVLNAHYRQNINFTWEALNAAKTALSRLRKIVQNLKYTENAEYNDQYLLEFTENLKDDLNTPSALATLWTMLKDEAVNDNQKYHTALKMDTVLSLNLSKKIEEKEITPEIQNLINQREKYRQEKNWVEADKIRDELSKLGYNIKDR